MFVVMDEMLWLWMKWMKWEHHTTSGVSLFPQSDETELKHVEGNWMRAPDQAAWNVQVDFWVVFVVLLKTDGVMNSTKSYNIPADSLVASAGRLTLSRESLRIQQEDEPNTRLKSFLLDFMKSFRLRAPIILTNTAYGFKWHHYSFIFLTTDYLLIC